jgi:hypothetical protein
MRDIFVGIGLGFILTSVIVQVVPNSDYRVRKEALRECEKSLPRDQHCKMIAIPIIP